MMALNGRMTTARILTHTRWFCATIFADERSRIRAPLAMGPQIRAQRKEHRMCTAVRFTDTAGHAFWGRNYDWNVSYGEHPVVMPKGFSIPQQFGDPYPAPHAAIGMAVEYHGYPLFFNCGNDAGLAVGGLNFAGYARFEPKPVAGKTNIAAYEMPVWVAANFATVDEVEAALRNVAIIDAPIGLDMPVAMLHWHIADAKRSIVVEYQADGMHVHDDPVDVLTNQPPFGWHLENLRNYLACNGSWPGQITWRNDTMTPFGTGSTMRGIPGDYYATSRFVKAAFVNAFYPAKESEYDNVMRMIHTLGSVAFTEGCAQMEDGSFETTLFSDCFSAASGTYCYSTCDDPTLRCARLADYAAADSSALVHPDMHPYVRS